VGIVDDFNGSQHMMLTIDSERPVTYRAALARAASR